MSLTVGLTALIVNLMAFVGPAVCGGTRASSAGKGIRVARFASERTSAVDPAAAMLFESGGGAGARGGSILRFFGLGKASVDPAR